MKKSNSALFALVVLVLTTSIWWDYARLRIPMFFATAIFLTFLFLLLKFSRIFHSGLFALLLLSSVCFLFPGLNLSDRWLSIWIHSAPATLYLPFASLGLLTYILVKRNFTLLKITLIIVGIFIVYTAFQTTRADINASRHFAGNAVTMEDIYIVLDNLENGVMAYGHIHSIPFVLVGLVCVFRRNCHIWIKVLAVILAFLCSYALLKSGYTAAVLSAILAVALSCISSRRRGLPLFLLAFCGCIFLVVLKLGLQYSLLETIRPMLDPRSNLVSKIDGYMMTHKSYSGGNAYVEGRTRLYAWSWQTFLEHPLVGAGKGSAGGHSYLLDLMCDYGLLYFIPYMIYNFFVFRFIGKALPRDVRWYYFSAVLVLAGLLSIKAEGLIAQHQIMCLVLPLLLVTKKSDFYVASAQMRRQLRLPPLMIPRGL